jgi:hypothetical protein
MWGGGFEFDTYEYYFFVNGIDMIDMLIQEGFDKLIVGFKYDHSSSPSQYDQLFGKQFF